MGPRDGDRGIRRRQGTNLLLAASQRLYGALLALYPVAFRRRYTREMRRDFGDLSREGLEEGGGSELVRVWAATLSDLVVTALKERSTVSARNVHPSVDPRTAARAMVAVVFVALTVAVASLSITPQYEASTTVLIGKQGSEGSALEMEIQQLQDLTLTLAEVTRSRPIAEETIERLGLSTTPEVFLERLQAEPIENTQFIELSYTDPDPEKARRVANTVGDVLSQRVSEVGPSADAMTATLWQRAPVPEEPTSPNPLRNGLLTLVSGLLLCAGLAFALPRVAASGIGRAALRATGAVGLTASGSRGAPTGAPSTKGAKEKELLEALGRRGKLTVAGVALETSLTVEEADWMLSALAAKGHLEVTVEHGRLLYSLWEGDVPI
ncbi:MAG: Wzz/FepE/Etk N-terminal domain-containing protein [Actinomycetota bacterium]|nr:Wzz/FepE/Etk N-terminal domain-containing protein [Actinomycetota bacterium]